MHNAPGSVFPQQRHGVLAGVPAVDYHRHVQLLRQNKLPFKHLRLERGVVAIVVTVKPDLAKRRHLRELQQPLYPGEPVLRKSGAVLRVNACRRSDERIPPGKRRFLLRGSQVVAHRHYLFNAHLRHSGKQAVQPLAEILPEVVRVCVEYSHIIS